MRPQLGRNVILPPSSRILMRCFTKTPRRWTQTRPSGHTNKPQPSQPVNNDNIPAFSLEGLGMSKNPKIFLLVVFSILGTIETWFWCKAIWRWWKGSSGEKDGP